MSEQLAGWIAHGAFAVLLAIGAAFGELGRTRIALFVLLWIVGFFGLPRLFVVGGSLLTSYVAVLDIVLVFIIFKGDVRLN